MVVDLRQVMAAILTFSMFIMLGNMIKRDHIDPLFETAQESTRVSGKEYTVSKTILVVKESYGPWQKHDYKPPKRCWKKPTLKGIDGPNNGYIFFSLTRDPEFHPSQVANAVKVARRLGATLALPDIKGTNFGGKKSFGDIYDVKNFFTSLTGVVRVDDHPPIDLSNSRLHTVMIPEGVSEVFISSEIEPVFRAKRNLRIVTRFDSSPVKAEEYKLASTYQCPAMFESLKLQAELQGLVDSMVGVLRSLSQASMGRFVVVDLRSEMLQKNICQEAEASSKRCYDGEEMAEFLKRIGFREQTSVYLTQTGWRGGGFKEFRNAFPKTFTKDVIMPAYGKAKFLNSEIPEYERLLDYFMCVNGDVFVPAVIGRFYSSVLGQRIASGRTQVFVPAENRRASSSNDSAIDYLSLYILKKNHEAHSCFC